MASESPNCIKIEADIDKEKGQGGKTWMQGARFRGLNPRFYATMTGKEKGADHLMVAWDPLHFSFPTDSCVRNCLSTNRLVFPFCIALLHQQPSGTTVANAYRQPCSPKFTVCYCPITRSPFLGWGTTAFNEQECRLHIRCK